MWAEYNNSIDYRLSSEAKTHVCFIRNSSVSTRLAKRHYTEENRNLRNSRCENHRSYGVISQKTELLLMAAVGTLGPPLWSSGQSSWLQIRRIGFDSRHYQKKKVVGLERGPLSLVSTTEELLDRKVAAPA
jgi:hypothetical protein